MFINKSNTLIQDISYDLESLESKILSKIVSMIDSRNDKLRRYYQFDLNSFDEFSINNNYEQLKAATRSLSNKGFEILKDNGETELFSRWVSSVITTKGSGIIRVEIPSEMEPYYVALHSNFTSFQALQVFQLRSKFSIRFYELLYSHLVQKKVTYSLQRLKKMLKVQNKYSDWRNFKIRVLEKAMSELKEKTDLSFTYKVIGRGVSKEIEFTITKKKTKQEPVVLSGLETELQKMGFNDKERKKIFDMYDDDKIKRNLQYTLKQKAAGKIKTHPKALFRIAVKMDYDSTDYSKTIKDNLEEVSELELRLEEINKKAEMQDDFMTYLAKATERNKKGRAAKLVGLIQEHGVEFALNFKDNPNLYNLGVLVEQFFTRSKNE